MSSTQRDADHLWHVWLNRWNRLGESFDHSMYEFKSMLDFLRYGSKQIEKAFTGDLPKTHRHCSHSPTETIDSNCLKCALGKDVTQCEILVSIKTVFDEERRGHYSEIPDAEVYRVMANTCAWHMYTEPIRTQRFVDTSEGWLMDEGDRRFWSRVYESMATVIDGGPNEA